MKWRFNQWMQRSAGRAAGSFLACSGRAALCLFLILSPNAFAAESHAVADFRKQVQPILVQYCYDCHGDGMNKGKVAFDELKSEEDFLGKSDLWFAVLKNLRAGLMPP